MLVNHKQSGFTIVELLIVIVVIGILAAITVVAYNGIQTRAKDQARISKIKEISKAIEAYYVDNGHYPQAQDANGSESSCGSQTENWGHCDRSRTLSLALAPYMKFTPESLSSTAPDAVGNNYYYTSYPATRPQTYGLLVYLAGDAGQNDGGYYAGAYEVGPLIKDCMSRFTGTQREWSWGASNPYACNGDRSLTP